MEDKTLTQEIMADKTPPKKLLRDKSLLRDFEIFEDTEDLKLIISLDSESLKLKKKQIPPLNLHLKLTKIVIQNQ